MKAFLVILLFTHTVIAFSQTSRWKEGYIITNNFDTIKGYIATNKISSFYKIEFKKNPGDKPLIYESTNLKGYSTDGNLYRTLFIPKEMTGMNNYIFANQLQKGSVDLYWSKYRFMACPCEPQGGVNQGYILIKNDSLILIVSRKGITKKIKNIEALADLLEENAELFQNIQQNKYTYNQIPEIVKKYNAEN